MVRHITPLMLREFVVFTGAGGPDLPWERLGIGIAQRELQARAELDL